MEVSGFTRCYVPYILYFKGYFNNKLKFTLSSSKQVSNQMIFGISYVCHLSSCYCPVRVLCSEGTRHHTFIAIKVIIPNAQGFETIFWTANINLPSVKHCYFDNFYRFVSVNHMQLYRSPHRYLYLRCRLHLIAIFIYAVAFTSSLSSYTLSPSPNRSFHLPCHLCFIACCCLHLCFHIRFRLIAVFIHCHLRSIYPKHPFPSNTEKVAKKGASQQTAYGDRGKSPWNVALGTGAVLPHGLCHGGNSRRAFWRSRQCTSRDFSLSVR
ncbi:hypothetical protein OUZ56_014656 [Daphnia magna]|uniref:Uncharacterized protein n=1 Tax=Daphnia magna TaxID=35525 RepID=A0ABR0AKF7_9CRUS|nr:hypothetical protein OUZ56_014656 [Daphnia magna]